MRDHREPAGSASGLPAPPTRRGILLGSAAVAAALGNPALVRAQAREIVVGGPSSMAELMRSVIAPRFEAANKCKVLFEPARSVVNLQKLRASRGSPPFSVVMMDFDVMLNAHHDGLLDTIAVASVPNARDVPAIALPYDGAWLTYSTPRVACSFSTKALPGGLPSWASLWEPRFKGRLSLPSMSLTSTPPLLAMAASLATGKPPAEAQYDIDAGFRKLAELKPNLIGVHTSGQQAQTLLEQGAVWAIPADIGSYVLRRKAEGLPFDFNRPSEGSFGLPAGAALVKGGANRELAELFIGELLDPRVQAELVTALAIVPSNPKVAPGADGVPLAELLTTDWEFVAKNRAAWIDRFDREIAR